MSIVRSSTSAKPIAKLELLDSKLDVSFTVTQLSAHNNSKKGYWIAIDGIVYDVSKSIDAFPQLIPYAGTDISSTLFPGIKEKLSQYLIGQLINPYDKIKGKVKPLLYQITAIENELDYILSSKKDSAYAAIYTKSKMFIESIFSELSIFLTYNELSYLKKAIENFAVLNNAFLYTKMSASDYYEILFEYKGLTNLLKFMFEKYIELRFNGDVFIENLRLLAGTEQNDVFNLISKSSEQQKRHKITIVGGSITGLALSMQLKQLGLDVEVYDKYDDPRIKYLDHASASFSIFITDRGLKVLERLGLKNKLLEISQAVIGRSYHQGGSDVREDLNGPSNEKLLLVKRDSLLALLATQAESMGVGLNFDTECKSVSIKESSAVIDAVHVHNKQAIKINTDVVFGADGSNSTLRRMMDSQLSAEEKSTVEQHKQVYCEFLLPADEKGQARFDQSKLHVWPRDGFTFVAFPTENNSFSLSLFIDKTKPELPRLQSDPEFLASFVQKNVPELYPYVHKIILTEPAKRWGVLNKVNSKKWYDGCHLSLIGDAAHGCYPFNGQGANCDLEDTLVMHDLISGQIKTKGMIDWSEVFGKFSSRKFDTDIMANYTKVPPGEMSCEQYKLLKRIEFALTIQGVPSFFYLMSFTSLPYSKVRTVTAHHDSLLNEVFDILAKKEGVISNEVIMMETAKAISRKRYGQDHAADSSMHSMFKTAKVVAKKSLVSSDAPAVDEHIIGLPQNLRSKL